MILLLYATFIKADVTDFDFRHIVTFLNNLSTGERNALPNITRPSTRTIEITLSVCPKEDWEYVDGDLLRCWLKRANHPTKKGTQVQFTYVRGNEVEQVSQWVLLYGQREPDELYCWRVAMQQWRRLLVLLAETSKGGRGKTEAGKMLAVL